MGLIVCPECKKQVSDKADSCPNCGYPINAVKVNTGYKCPNCYYILPSFVEKCPACGCEIRSNKVSKSVEDFSLKLAEIEKNNKAKKNKIMSSFNENIDDERISFIKNYPIPNNKEDIIEFLLLASSNISLSDYDNGYNRVQEVEAWKSMYDHAYEKAKILLAGTSEFTDIKKTHDELEKSISSHKKKSNMITAILFIGSIIFYIILMYWLR